MLNEPSVILVVDDNPDNTYLIKNLIESRNLEVLIAESGEQALDILMTKKVDLVLLDIMLPEMDGYEICQIINGNPKISDIPVIFLSAKFMKDDILKGFRVGAVDYVTKPFNKDELLSRVRTHIELKKSRDFIKDQKLLLEKQNKQLVDLNATKDKFFSIVAHDLKNPFNTILGFSRLLVRRYNTMQESKRKDFIKLIYESSERAFNLLENLLEWSRTQTGRIQFSPRMINLSDVVKSVILLMQTSAGKKQISLISHVDDGIKAYADEDMVTFVIRNLVSNALKFTPSEGKVTISCDIDEQVFIKVRDSGVGIKSEVLPKLFKLDANISTKGTEEEPGTGLGLILCKEFIERNNGSIDVESEVGKGSTFTIRIPVKNNNE